MKYLTRIFVLLLLFLLPGCATTSSSPSLPSSVPTSETLPPTQVQHANRGWKITPTTQPQTYSSLLTTVITQTDIPAARHDSLVTQALYSISTTKFLDTISFSGSITAFTIRGNTSESEEADFITPIFFTGSLSNHTINAKVSSGNRLQDQDNCQNPQQTPLRVIQRNLFALPLEIAADQSWTDSTSSLVCSGTLPITYTVIRTLTVAGESELEGNPVLVLNQSERTFSSGEGSQGQHRIIVEGQGLTNGRLYINLVSGQLVAVNSTNKTSLSIQSSGRIQHFSENSTEITQKVR